ncbi:DUF4266 domain-containing protein [Pelagicoccus sp. SDUM812003]|uniref:DUF4266 domain-containing protein n=1 Tax=Pelagicoccus sp. SDUM812003 TaxID=3041267 RepID=UPI00280E3373|nr:DUF4266 domain-containing protein [Pelagicoccus sp. SDUM812003]MDQ8205090.1 DUF4266 domain-containing protein [Pelagicoccus sp. SDUM812003]
MTTRPLILRLSLLFALLAGLAGCASVEPWEKARFADYTMREDRDPLEDAMTSHIHFSREATHGGGGLGGGGCGCN